ncbi:DUF3783 domain-containing protein [Pectinatus sottacetonis]|uniref:DUF3783 domain-containing protein n=1 Tax=Pectinatus sottacetonis TaxID=1002795 RepID=UPI001E3BE76B|nr:DUF3783 domain-containing protein [Pectinatus sottacetonis]
MKIKRQEKVLIYNFNEVSDEEKACDFFQSLHIKTIVLSPDAFCQKVGFLLGITGFSRVEKTNNANFYFCQKVIVFYNIKNKRLDEVLQKMRQANINIAYKAVVTPLNRFWSLQRLCLSMQKEHGFFLDKKRNE